MWTRHSNPNKSTLSLLSASIWFSKGKMSPEVGALSGRIQKHTHNTHMTTPMHVNKHKYFLGYYKNNKSVWADYLTCINVLCMLTCECAHH